MTEAMKIEHGAAGEDRDMAAIPDSDHQGLCVFVKLAGGIGCKGIEDVNQVMRDAATLIVTGFCGANVHAAIDQGGVDTDDFTTQFLGKTDR